MRKQILLVIIASFAAALSPPSIAAQATPPVSVVEQATAMRDRGDLAGAARILEMHVASFPEDGTASRLLAHTRYWLKDVTGATTLYDAGLALHPHDTAARLDYARMLMETGSDARAIALLEPLRTAPGVQSRVSTMLGTMAYWRGDLSAAARHFELALETDPADADARRQLGEIRSLSTPWLALLGGGHSDDQPITGYSGGAEAGWFVTPLTSMSVRLDQLRFDTDFQPSLTATLGEGRLTHYSATLHTEIKLAAGAVRRSFGSNESDWTGRASVRLRLPRQFFAEGRAERSPYFHTVASLITPIMIRSAAAVVGVDHSRGWLGEAAVQIQSFPDTNTIGSAHAWLLAPVARGRTAELQIGYAFSSQNAESSRFVLSRPIQLVIPADPTFNTDGVYAPYYTPDNLRSHSALAGLTLRPSSSSTVRVNGAYGFSASQNLPYLARVAGIPSGAVTVERFTARQSFSPWNVRGSIEQGLGERIAIAAHAEHSKTAFYAVSAAGLRLMYRFSAGLSRSESF